MTGAEARRRAVNMATRQEAYDTYGGGVRGAEACGEHGGETGGAEA